MKRTGRVSSALFRRMALSGLLAVLLPTAAPAACPQWNITGEWKIIQSNDTVVDFTFRQNGTVFKGNGGFWGRHPESNGPEFLHASVVGTIEGNSIEFIAHWRHKAIGHYSGAISSKGRISGTGYEGRSPEEIVTWYSRKAATCLASSGSALSTDEPGTIKAGGRVKLDPSNTPPGPPLEICEAARRARERNSPAAPGLTASCLAAGGGEATQEISE